MDFSKLKRDIHPMPEDVEQALLSEHLMETYHSRPPYQQNDYTSWITRAKRPETRQKRLDQMIAELRDGHMYMGMKYRTKQSGLTCLYFIRHCESDRIVKGGRFRPLTEKGIADSEKLVGYFDGTAMDAIYSSPYKRAVDTVLPLASARGLPVQIKEDLRERTSNIPSIGELDAFLRHQWEDLDFAESEAESLRQLQSRNVAAIRKILTEGQNKTAVIATHGMALLTIMNYYKPDIGYHDFVRIVHLLPYIVHMDFIDGKFNEMTEINPLDVAVSE